MRAYHLTVTGVVSFDDHDADIERLLLKLEGTDKERIEIALQELEETAVEVKVYLNKT